MFSRKCPQCGKRHRGLQTVFGASEPLAWATATAAERATGEINADLCTLVLEGRRHFFIRGRIEIPIHDGDGSPFAWMVWVSLSDDSWDTLMEHWDDPDRVNLKPRFGWLNTELPYETSTLNMETHVHSREPGQVPFIVVDHSLDHPLARDQHHGFTMHDVAAINARLT